MPVSITHPYLQKVINFIFAESRFIFYSLDNLQEGRKLFDERNSVYRAAPTIVGKIVMKFSMPLIFVRLVKMNAKAAKHALITFGRYLMVKSMS